MAGGAVERTERGRDALIALRRILRATEIGGRRLARETGLTSSQLTVLRLLADGETTPGAIPAGIGLTQATVTALIARLAARGLVIRRRGESDRRRVWIDLTEEGQALLASMPSDLQATFHTEFAKLASWEQAMMVATLERLVGMLNAGQLEAGPVLEFGDLSPSERE